MADTKLIIAELRAGDLLAALQSAVDGHPHWRIKARELLADINDLRLPPLAAEYLREIDARKRAAEIMESVCHA